MNERTHAHTHITARMVEILRWNPQLDLNATLCDTFKVTDIDYSIDSVVSEREIKIKREKDRERDTDIKKTQRARVREKERETVWQKWDSNTERPTGGTEEPSYIFMRLSDLEQDLHYLSLLLWIFSHSPNVSSTNNLCNHLSHSFGIHIISIHPLTSLCCFSLCFPHKLDSHLPLTFPCLVK